MKWHLVLLVLALAGADAARAAQLGTIDADDTPLLQGPRKNAVVIRKLKQGTHLDVSNYPTQGYYKVRTRDDKQIGWVDVDTVDLAKPQQSDVDQPQ